MHFRGRKDLAIAAPVVAAVVVLHVLLALEVVRLSERWLVGFAIGLLAVVVAALHVVAFRRLTAHRER